MLSPILLFLGSLGGFLAADRALTAAAVKNPYYLLHSAHNAAIVWLTLPDLTRTFTDIHGLAAYDPNYEAAALVFALHIYHCILYWRRFLLDDWLHHALMIFVALPIGVLTPSSALLGFSLFFSTGLSGGLDYLLLFLVRNGWLHPMREKAINRQLHLWIRGPGCVAHAAFTAALSLSQPSPNWLGLVPAALMFWNGQYFLNQVVSNYSARAALEKAALHAP